MAWKRSSVRTRLGPPKRFKPEAALHSSLALAWQTDQANNKQGDQYAKGEYNHVSQSAKGVPLTILKKPNVRRFPTARSANTKPRPQTPASNSTANRPGAIQPDFPITMITANARRPQTTQVASGDGSKLRRPWMVGTV